MKLPLIFALAFVSLVAQPPRPNPNRKSEIREMKATGCVRKGIGDCLRLTTLDGQTTYAIFAKTPPPVGIVITIDGKQRQEKNTCSQGIPIDVTHWEETGETCDR